MAVQQGWLPREGFTADTLQHIVKKSILNPVLTLPLLLFAQYTNQGKKLTAAYEQSFNCLRLLAYIGLVRILNRALNRKSLDNWETHTWDWSRELVVITGGSDGFGKHIARLLADRSIRVVILDIQPPTYHLPPNIHFLHCDIASSEAISKTAKAIQTTHGHPTVLINNAGIGFATTILDTSDETLTRTFAVNTLAHFRLVREFLPPMITRNHGMIVTVASMSAYVTPPQMVDYACTKAAALSFHEGLGMELKTRYAAPKVRTLCVCPSWARTKLAEGHRNTASFMSPTLSPETVAEAVVVEVLAGRSGVLFLPRVHEWLGSCVRAWPWWLQDGLRMLSKDSVPDRAGSGRVVGKSD